MNAKRTTLSVLILISAVGLVAAQNSSQDKIEVPGSEGRFKSSATERAQRRAYNGAPPVIPHEPFGAACVACHTGTGVEVPGIGFSPPSPHGETPGMTHMSRCQQCHVFQDYTAIPFTESVFEGLEQDLRQGDRLYPGAPPVIPHRVFMRESCLSCHSGPQAREEIRTSHPERTRCLQCHAIGVANTDVSPQIKALSPGLIE